MEQALHSPFRSYVLQIRVLTQQLYQAPHHSLAQQMEVPQLRLLQLTFLQ